jgi:hypothetical protein
VGELVWQCPFCVLLFLFSFRDAGCEKVVVFVRERALLRMEDEREDGGERRMTRFTSRN